MTLEEKVQQVLVAATGVTDLVPASAIKVGFVGQSLVPPYISHEPSQSEETRTHDGRAKLEIWRAYQVGCFATSYSGALAIARAVLAALQSYRSGIVTISAVQSVPMYDATFTPAIHKIPVLFEFAAENI